MLGTRNGYASKLSLNKVLDNSRQRKSRKGWRRERDTLARAANTGNDSWCSCSCVWCEDWSLTSAGIEPLASLRVKDCRDGISATADRAPRRLVWQRREKRFAKAAAAGLCQQCCSTFRLDFCRGQSVHARVPSAPALSRDPAPPALGRERGRGGDGTPVAPERISDEAQ